MFKFITSVWLILMVNIAHAGQDPMKPPSWFAVERPAPLATVDISLQQVLISGDRKIAIINNMILKEGESISGVKILTIENNRIRVRQEGINKYISLLPVAKEVNREI